MNGVLPTAPSSDFLVTDLEENRDFLLRDAAFRPEAEVLPSLRTLAHELTYAPSRVLRHVVETALQICGADGAGICLDEPGALHAEDVPVALAVGTCASLTCVEVARAQSACSVAMENGRAQLFQIPASWLPVTEPELAVAHGITVPWQSGELRGTLWILTHTRGRDFDSADYRTLLTLADFAAIAHRNLQQREQERHTTCTAASGTMVHALTQHVHAPLEAITSSVLLAMHGETEAIRSRHLQESLKELQSLSRQVHDLLLQHRPVHEAAQGSGRLRAVQPLM